MGRLVVYPSTETGAADEAIPLSGRLVAAADVYDALIRKRIDKPPMPHGEAVKAIVEGSGSHFDPSLADAFLALVSRFEDIARVWIVEERA